MELAVVETIPDKDSATPRIIGQRDAYFDALFPIFQRDKNCILISADNGAPSMDQFVAELPEQFIQVGIAEQQMFGMAAGLAVEGKRVYCYAIAPFVTTRVHEFIKLDVCAMTLPITLLGVGAGYAYDIMGPTHHTVEDISIMRCLPSLNIWSPSDSLVAELLAEKTYDIEEPHYIRFDRAGVPNLYADIEDLSEQVSEGTIIDDEVTFCDVVILATGIMVHQAYKVAEWLKPNGIVAMVQDVVRLKPLPELVVCDRPLVTMEEHFLAGGFGSIIAEWLADNRLKNPLLRLGRTEQQGYCYEVGGRELIWQNMGLDVESVAHRIEQFLGQGI